MLSAIRAKVKRALRYFTKTPEPLPEQRSPQYEAWRLTQERAAQEMESWPLWMNHWCLDYAYSPGARDADVESFRPITDGMKAARYFGCAFVTKDQRDLAVRLMNGARARHERNV